MYIKKNIHPKIKIDFAYIDKDEKKIYLSSTESKIKNSSMNYNGIISTAPFYLGLDINLSKVELRKIFNNDSIFFELIKLRLSLLVTFSAVFGYILASSNTLNYEKLFFLFLAEQQ